VVQEIAVTVGLVAYRIQLLSDSLETRRVRAREARSTRVSAFNVRSTLIALFDNHSTVWILGHLLSRLRGRLKKTLLLF
jgi:hypothetical protein